MSEYNELFGQKKGAHDERLNNMPCKKESKKKEIKAVEIGKTYYISYPQETISEKKESAPPFTKCFFYADHVSNVITEVS